jgi:hypothetical protein
VGYEWLQNGFRISGPYGDSFDVKSAAILFANIPTWLLLFFLRRALISETFLRR